MRALTLLLLVSGCDRVFLLAEVPFDAKGAGDVRPDIVVPACAGTFGNPAQLDTGLHPYSLAITEVQGDGIPDLVTADQGANAISVLTGDGNGGFGRTTFAVGEGPVMVVPALLDASTSMDLVVLSQFGNKVQLLYNDGFGGFAVAKTYATGGSPYGVAVAKLDADDLPDVVVANYTSQYVSVYRMLPTRELDVPSQLPMIAGGEYVRVADLDGDHALDLAVTNYDKGQFFVAMGDGTGNFGALTGYPTGSGPDTLAVADIDNDTLPDVVTADYLGGTYTISHGSSMGFAPPVTSPLGPKAFWVEADDFDRNGVPDLVFSVNEEDKIAVLLGDGTGGFLRQDYPVGSGPIGVAVGDLNADTLPDLAVANWASNTVSVLYNCPQ